MVEAEIVPPPGPETPPEVANVVSGEAMPIAVDEWQVVGLWSYDGESVNAGMAMSEISVLSCSKSGHSGGWSCRHYAALQEHHDDIVFF